MCVCPLPDGLANDVYIYIYIYSDYQFWWFHFLHETSQTRHQSVLKCGQVLHSQQPASYDLAITCNNKGRTLQILIYSSFTRFSMIYPQKRNKTADVLLQKKNGIGHGEPSFLACDLRCGVQDFHLGAIAFIRKCKQWILPHVV